MKNYKIRVNNEAESKEIITLFIQLGYNDAKSDRFGFVYTSGGQIGCDQLMHWDYYSDRIGFQEITLPQLHDLVVLYRNDVNDANYSLAVASDRPDYPVFKSSESIFYTYSDNNKRWVECKSINDKTTGLKPLSKPQPEPEFQTIKVKGLEGLIEGKEALRAALDGEVIQFNYEPLEERLWVDLKPLKDDFSIKTIFTNHDSEGRKVFFRLKPRIILINSIEVPAPTEPKIGDDVWFISSVQAGGYNKVVHSGDCDYLLGVWDSEEKIKVVVDALCKVLEVQS